MSLKDIVNLSVVAEIRPTLTQGVGDSIEEANEALRQYEAVQPSSPGDYGTLTMYELHWIYTVARERVKLHSPIFQSLVLEWEVSPQFMMLMLRLSARVRNRDDLVAISDNERREVRRMVESDLIGRSAPIVALAYDRPTHANIVSIVTNEAVRIPPGLHTDEEALVTFLSHHAREKLHAFVRHEVDEMLLVNNERRFDPHRSFTLNGIYPR